MLGRIARLTWRRPRSVLAAVAAFALVAGALGHDVEHRLKAAGFTDPASESERATAAVRDALGYDAGPGIVVLVRARGGGNLDTQAPRIRREVDRLSAALAGVRDVGAVADPRPARDGRSLVLVAHLSTQDVEDAGGIAAEAAMREVRSDVVDVSFGGFAVGFNEVNDQTREDLTTAELIAFPALTVLLLLVFRGVIAAALPLLIGVLSIVGTFLVLRVMSGLVDTSLFALNIATALSLGLAVDYALLLVSRYREEVAMDGATERAHRRTVETAGRTVLFSGFTVAAAMAALVIMPQRFLYSVGAAGAAVGVLSAVIAVLVVPALLALLGTRIDKWSVRRGPAVSATSGGWYRVAAAVMRRPVVSALLSAGLLLAVASPFTSAELTGPSAQAVPPGQQSYEVVRYLEAHYGRDVVESVPIAVRGGDGDVGVFARAVERVEGVAAVGTPRRADGLTVLRAALEDPALSARAQDAVHAIRDLPPPAGAEVLVSGNTARFIDEKESLVANAPVVISLIAAGTLVLLFALTGSVLLPLKTLLMNALTLAATLGILVLGFQEEWLRGLLDDTGPAAIEVTSLVFLFVVTFALATDYAVLVMARIKEQHDRGEPNELAVATGIGRTGRIISAAAVMIAVVFLAFAVSPVFFMKQIAVGMAVGVLLDATIVRAFLVPSLMRLLGEWNWWAPRPLARLQQRFGFSEA